MGSTQMAVGVLWLALATEACGAIARPVPEGTVSQTDAMTPSPSADAGHSVAHADSSDEPSLVDAATATPDVSPAAALDLSGRWAMFGFEDPVAVEIHQVGNTLSGQGCAGGLPTDQGDFFAGFCGPLLNGALTGGRAQFAFQFQTYAYLADVMVSANGDRMTGLFHGTSDWMGPMAWLRIDPQAGWLESKGDDQLNAAATARKGRYDLNVVEAPALESAYASGHSYALNLTTYRQPLIAGDLGSFWATEMKWRQAEQTIAVGPVSATAPNLPVELALEFDGTVLARVRASTPSGAHYTFVATPHVD